MTLLSLLQEDVCTGSVVEAGEVRVRYQVDLR